MWSAFLFQTTTGQVGPQVPFHDQKWSVSLNDTEKFSLELKKSSLPNLDLKYWLDPWWAGVLICWKGEPIVAGPITQRPTESFDDISLECSGIRAVLARRLALTEKSDWTSLAKTELAYRNMSLGSIAREVVKVAQNRPGGVLPIRYPVLEGVPGNLPECQTEDGNNCYWNAATRGNGKGSSFYRINGVTTYVDNPKGTHERTYKGFNLSNIFVDDVLTKLSEVINGPDIMFRPRLVASNQLVFDMVYGTEKDPRLPQTSDVVFDTTAQYHGVSELRVVVTGSYQTHRVFATGAGQDEGTLIRMAQNLDPTKTGYPFLESVYDSGDSENADVVLNHARGNLQQNTANLLEMSMKVSAEGLYPLGSYQVGDVVQIITKGWVSLSDGAHKARVLNINGDSSTSVNLSLQTED